MKKPTFWPKPIKTNYEYEDGESIEDKVKRVVEGNEPIEDGAPIIFTNRDDGVIPAYNIRTDRWDIALEAMDAVNKQNIAKSKNVGAKPEQQDDTKEGDTLATETQASA